MRDEPVDDATHLVAGVCAEGKAPPRPGGGGGGGWGGGWGGAGGGGGSPGAQPGPQPSLTD